MHSGAICTLFHNTCQFGYSRSGFFMSQVCKRRMQKRLVASRDEDVCGMEGSKGGTDPD